LSFIKDHVVPFHTHHFGLVLWVVHDQIVRCNQNVNLHVWIPHVLGVKILA
jgi:hypothetical protein